MKTNREMKEKIIEILHNLVLADDLATTWKIKCHKSATAIEHLVDQEVERRIAERMPSDEERHIAASEYEHKESMGYSEMDKLTGLYRNIDFEAGADWACSRLTNPGVNDSQKTEGGGE